MDLRKASAWLEERTPRWNPEGSRDRNDDDHDTAACPPGLVGNAFHDFTVSALDVMIDVPAGATASGGLTVTEPGEYTYECTVPGHAAAGMTGTLVVERGGLESPAPPFPSYRSEE